MTPDAPEATRLNRDAVIDVAIDMLDQTGLDNLSMRALADRLEVKAASLYWHIRDKVQLLDLVAETVLERVDVSAKPTGWRAQVDAARDSLAAYLVRHPGAVDVLLAALPVVQRSRLTRHIAQVLGVAGLEDPESAAFALVVQVVAEARLPRGTVPSGGQAFTLRIDSGSWRVAVRPAPPGTVDVAGSEGGGGAPWVDVKPDGDVLVRNRRGGFRGAVLLSPAHTWYVKVHGGTWNTTLDLSGLRVSGIELDSGAGNLTCTLPMPVGTVPLKVNSGIMGVTMAWPRDAAVHATVSSGCAKIRLGDRPIRATGSDIHWDTLGALQNPNRYDVTIHSGCYKITMDGSAPASAAPAVSPSDDTVQVKRGHAVELLLDGVEQRLSATPPRPGAA
ncbi:MAG: TetR family transcriptional regulator [Candidatus Dormibacteraeota bacterium]|nr:TetR family transcriptional regulator [Candidatus Dormibacteraeota bacterium]